MATNQLFATKKLNDLLAEAKGDDRLKRVLGPVSLTALGIGAIIGAGIFVSTGSAAKEVAGPALMLSYVVAGLTCIFAALCYAEFASMAPVAGSAYTYAYCTMGELFAWIIGWDLVLEYAVGSATVANGWSGYFQAVIAKVGIVLPKELQSAPIKFNHSAPWNDFAAWFEPTGSFVNLPAVIIVAIITAVLVKGISESAGFNAFMVGIKVFAVLFVILVGYFFINPANYEPFAPFGYGGFSLLGVKDLSVGWDDKAGKPLGMLAGAAIIFFAYIGFDSVSTHAEEAKNPSRDVPIGIIASLIVCTILYIGVVAVLTGMVSYKDIDKNAGVSSAFKEAAKVEGISPLMKSILLSSEVIIACAGVAGITSVLLVMMLSGPRVFLAMARDGLVPKAFFADVHPTFKTPWLSTIGIGIFVMILAGLLPIDALLELANIGTLFAFAVVCAAVMVMRQTNPTAARPFRCPLVPIVPILGIALCILLMLSLPVGNWLRLVVWLLIGLVIYFGYGKQHSTLGKSLRNETAGTP
ncbi:MAG: amino acid permease [Planctomycetia bacterium]|nr:amino acid permease [Planctomycetia bacterium]